MYNYTRWALYTRQRYGKDYNGPWVKLTPNQRRRMNKKARSRNDESVGIFS